MKQQSFFASSVTGEQALIIQLRNANTLAFDQLYLLYSRKLYAAIRYQVKDDDIARDITQEVFMKLWQSRGGLDAALPLGPYLYRIARNLVVDHFRKIAGNRKLSQDFMDTAIAFYTHTEEGLEYKETKAIVQAAINTLPPQQKQVYTKCRLQGMSHEEISSEMGISKATVNNHIVKANKTVLEFVKRNGGLLGCIVFLEWL